MKKKLKPLKKSELYTCCDLKAFNFETTDDLDELTEIVGQERALKSLHFGIGVHQNGFNLYVQGASGMGKHTTVKHILKQYVSSLPCPDDWCYVYNFADPFRPLALRLKSGYADQLKEDMDALIEDIRLSIPVVFESDEYHNKIKEIEERIKSEQEIQFSNLQKKAQSQDLTILSTPHGFAVAPTKKGEVISNRDYEALSAKEKKIKEKNIKEIKISLSEILSQTPRWQKLLRLRKKELQNELASVLMANLLKDLRKKYRSFNSVVNYIKAVGSDIVENISSFIEPEEENKSPIAKFDFNRYKVNIFVTHKDKSVPIIYEDNPTYPNLIGRIEQKVQFGVLVTDFTLIRPGALHRANGGFLIIDAHKVLTQPYAWAALKRVLYGHEVRIEPIGEMYGLLTTMTLEPQAIPIDLKVILIGDRQTYYLLCSLESDFKELFKVEVDFTEEMPRNDPNTHIYIRLLVSLIKKSKLQPFNHQAIARIIDYSSRLVGDSQRLSLHMRNLDDLLCEADYWAKASRHKIVKRSDVEKAILQQHYRSNRIQEKIYEEFLRKNLIILTRGKVIGQINALSVLSLGDHNFGVPARITATARIGKGEIVNIERESDLSGHIHSKGVLILSGFLYGRYAKEQHLSLLASLVFEQSYSEIDGDSASIAELCVLLSAISEIPLNQAFAITGAVDQLGAVQAIGGVNEKIESFFEICRGQGLTGEQGVIIPRANIKHLMLNHHVIQAVANRDFNIYAIDSVDEALELLTGIPAGERDPKGAYPPGTCNAHIEMRLREFAEGEHK